MSITSDFWKTRNENLPRLTDELIKKAEDELKVNLPTAYIELLKIRNGGYTNSFGFPTTEDNTWSENHIPFFELRGIHFNTELENISIMGSEYLINEWELDNDIIILTGEGHWWIVLDYRFGHEDPPVTWIEKEIGHDFVIAETFEKFINGLKPSKYFD